MTNIHEDIKALLDAGQKVFSGALGRVGEVLSVDTWTADGKRYSDVEICTKSRRSAPLKRHRHIHGCTSFINGDDVKLINKDGINIVVNTFKEFKGAAK